MKRYWIWLSLALGPGCPIVHAVLDAYESVEEIYQHREEIPGAFPEYFTPGRKKRWFGFTPEHADQILSDCAYNGYEVITVEDEKYPSLLFEIQDCPLVLYAEGKTELLGSMMMLGVVGTRSMTVEGCNATLDICIPLSRSGIVLVSGYNIGGDEFAHKAALAGEGGSIAVLPTGLDVPPRLAMRSMAKLIRKNGVFVTEFPPGTTVQRSSYHLRNRIISGMSMGLLVTQAPKQSGVMITADAAGEQGRDVFVIPASPGDPTFSGNLQLIRDGAFPVGEAQDIIGHLWPQTAPHSAEALRRSSVPTQVLAAQPQPRVCTGGSTLAESVLSMLQKADHTADELAEKLDVPIHKIQATLSILEIQGDVRPLAGKRFTLKK